jgi:hypothetical protein
VLKVELSSLPCAFSVQHASDLFEKNSIVIWDEAGVKSWSAEAEN